MSAPTPASGDSSPTPGYYPDPSIPGYVRFWNGASWVPGTSRPAPPDGDGMPAAPAGASAPAPAAPTPAAPTPSVEETGPVFFDEEPEGAHLHGNTPEPASAWQADTSRQTGFGGERDRRVSWGSSTSDSGTSGTSDTSGTGGGSGSDDPRRGGGGVDLRRTGGSSPEAPSEAAPRGGTPVAPAEPDPRGTAADPSGGALPGVRTPGRTPPPDSGTVTMRALRRGGDPESPRTAQADGTMAIRTMTPGARRPQVPGQGQGQGQVQASGQAHAAGQAPAAGQVQTPGQAQAPGQGQPAGQAYSPGQAQSAGQVQTPGQAQSSGQAQTSGQGQSAGQAQSPGQAQSAAQAHAPGQAQPAGQGHTPGQAHAPGQAQSPGQGHIPAQGHPSGQGHIPSQGQPSGQAQAAGQFQGPGQGQAGGAAAAPVSAGVGGGAASWAQQVHQLAQPDQDEAGAPPVVPWKPPVSDPFLQAAQAQAAARPAGLAKRLVARLIDTAVLGAAVGAVAVPLVSAALAHIDDKIEAAKLSGETVTVWLLDGTTAGYLGIVLGVYLLVGVVYEVVPTAKWGRTLGKKLCKMHVRDIEAHEPPTFGAALRRWLVYGVLGVLAIGIVNAAWCLFDRPWRQCWHDKAARTFVAGD